METPAYMYFDGPRVDLVDYMGNDTAIVKAARVSLKGANEVYMQNEELDRRDSGLINYLLREKHGSPFEHTSMTFYVKAPIFVFREFQRHRMASYNEMSGRYTKLEGDFYIPAWGRPMINFGTSSKPKMGHGDSVMYQEMSKDMAEVYELAWTKYHKMLEAGVANELARIVLPVGIFSQMYVTMNLRALFNFLSLRTEREDAVHISRPQYEIEQVADKMEAFAEQLYPAAFAAFNENGRVAP